MRLWHYKLIPYLPKKMLVSQWRECIAIKRQWEKGTLKHPLVGYVMKHNRGYFRNYVREIKNELNNRNIKTRYELFMELMKFINEDEFLRERNLYYPEHNTRYLEQCYYNLQEKYDRGMITDDEYSLIQDCVLKELEGVK